ncbi:MAG: SCO family protein [Proteobacteria bacterium]|nr:SCO family protein [Pseudomonadota bacterium]
MRRTLALALAAGCCAAWPGGVAADAAHASPQGMHRFEPPAPGSYDLPPIDRVTEHVLIGRDGSPAPLLGLAPGEAAIVSFVYLSCGEACPLATATLHHLDRVLADDAELASRVQLVTVSFDPERDSPAHMRALAERLSPRGRWRFLTTRDARAIAPVLADFGQDAVWVPDGDAAPAPERLRHVLKVFLVDADGAVRNVYSTGLMDVRLVVNDLRTVLQKSGPSDG